MKLKTEPKGENVFADLGFKNANELQAKAELTRQIANILESRKLSRRNAAKVLGIGRTAAYEAARTGQIPVIKIGKRLLVPKTALDRMLDEAGTSLSGNEAK